MGAVNKWPGTDTKTNGRYHASCNPRLKQKDHKLKEDLSYKVSSGSAKVTKRERAEDEETQGCSSCLTGNGPPFTPEVLGRKNQGSSDHYNNKLGAPNEASPK